MGTHTVFGPLSRSDSTGWPGLPLAALLLTAASAGAAETSGFVQTETDAYTRYELLEPASSSFRIVYDVSATTAGARSYFNPVRLGSEPTVHGVTDLATGKALEWHLIDAADARTSGLETEHEGNFIRVALARPVPAGGQGRIRIDKTYRDPASYHSAGDGIVFERELGVRRNAVVLPAGYELVACNYPAQVDREADGRIRVSFLHRGPDAVALRLAARRLPAAAATPTTAAAGGAQIQPREPISVLQAASARTDFELSQRAFEDRDIVYFLQQPETHSFRLYHDYTESRPGVDRYLNIVRPGSRATDPSAMVLDSGEPLRVETLRGAEITARGLDIGQAVEASTEVVVIWFEPVATDASTRLRIEETYTDPGRYGLDGDELLWDRSFGRSRNTVLLPPGWYLTQSSIPTVIDEADSGEIRLYFENDRPGDLEVLLRARRRQSVERRQQ